MNTIAPLIEESHRVLENAIKHFGLSVPAKKIVVTIQSRGRRNALGWFAGNRWKNGQPEAIHEINLCCESLKTHDMGETLLHELAHAENRHRGISDCTAAQVHNRKFKTMAEALGLTVKERHERFGYAFTDLGPAAKSFLKKIAFKHQLFALARLEEGTAVKVGSRLIKCECPECGYTVRITAKWIAVGLPTCPCGEEMEAAA